MKYEVCDKCRYGEGVCPRANDDDLITLFDEIVACKKYELNPAIILERDITRAMQQLIGKGIIQSGRIIRVPGTVLAFTFPKIPEGLLLDEMKHGHEMEQKEPHDDES